MQCERLYKLTKTWYLNVQDAAMAPARMLSFIEKHAASCEVCCSDPDLKEEIVKISAILLPTTKDAGSEQDDEEIDEADTLSGDDDLDEELDEELDDDAIDDIDDDELAEMDEDDEVDEDV